MNEDEYKVMGLAAYGQPSMVEEVRKLIRRTPDGAFALNLRLFRISYLRGTFLFVAFRRTVRPATESV